MKEITYYQHQKKFLESNPNRHMLVWGTGTGKTLTSLAWAIQPVEPTILVVPLTLMVNWERAILKWYGDDVRPMLKEKRVWHFYVHSAHFRLMTKEFFRDNYKKIGPAKRIIFDEAHYFSGHTSKMGKSAVAYTKANPGIKVLLLTATPYLSTPFNIMQLGRILQKDGFKWKYPYFKDHYFTHRWLGDRRIPVVVDNIKELMAPKINEIASVVAMEEVADVPKSNEYPIYFELTKQQDKGIKGLNDLEHIVRWTKTHQICGGSLKGDEYTESQEYKSDKFDWIKEFIKTTDKALIVCRYNNEVDRIAAECVKQKINHVVINGKVKNKQAQIDKAEADDKCIVIVNAFCSEGWEVKTVPIIVFYSYDFALKNYIQMKGRPQRIDKLQKLTIISLVIKDSIDEGIYKTVAIEKNDFQLSIYKDGDDTIVENEEEGAKVHDETQSLDQSW